MPQLCWNTEIQTFRFIGHHSIHPLDHPQRSLVWWPQHNMDLWMVPPLTLGGGGSCGEMHQFFRDMLFYLMKLVFQCDVHWFVTTLMWADTMTIWHMSRSEIHTMQHGGFFFLWWWSDMMRRQHHKDDGMSSTRTWFLHDDDDLLGTFSIVMNLLGILWIFGGISGYPSETKWNVDECSQSPTKSPLVGLSVYLWTFHLVSDKSPAQNFQCWWVFFSNDKIRKPVWDLVKISCKYFRISWPT